MRQLRLPRLWSPSLVDGAGERSRTFRSRSHARYWWHHLSDTDYVPSIYATLSDRDWAILEAWFAETEQKNLAGEINVPAMCLVQGFVSGGAISRIVQLGHYSGYSTLLIGFLLRRMNGRRALFSIDIDPQVTEYARRWVERAGLRDYVTLHVGDSADPDSAEAAARVLGDSPELVIVDSSHRYRHTLRELNQWVPRLSLGGLMLLHDTSLFGQTWDTTSEGGVHRALSDWLPDHPEVVAVNLNAFTEGGADADTLVYKDACGLGLLQKVAEAKGGPDQVARASA